MTTTYTLPPLITERHEDIARVQALVSANPKITKVEIMRQTKLAESSVRKMYKIVQEKLAKLCTRDTTEPQMSAPSDVVEATSQALGEQMMGLVEELARFEIGIIDLVDKGRLRVYGSEDEPYFRATEVAHDILGYENPQEALRMHVSSENVITWAEFVNEREAEGFWVSGPKDGCDISSPDRIQAHTRLLTFAGLLEIVIAAAKRFPEAQPIKQKIFAFMAQLRTNARAVAAQACAVAAQAREQLAQRDEQIAAMNQQLAQATARAAATEPFSGRLYALVKKSSRKIKYYGKSKHGGVDTRRREHERLAQMLRDNRSVSEVERWMAMAKHTQRLRVRRARHDLCKRRRNERRRTEAHQRARRRAAQSAIRETQARVHRVRPNVRVCRLVKPTYEEVPGVYADDY